MPRHREAFIEKCVIFATSHRSPADHYLLLLQTLGVSAPVLELKVMSAGTDPITQLQGADVVIMDPPRKGIEPELMEALLVSGLAAINIHCSIMTCQLLNSTYLATSEVYSRRSR